MIYLSTFLLTKIFLLNVSNFSVTITLMTKERSNSFGSLCMFVCSIVAPKLWMEPILMDVNRYVITARVT